MLQSAIPLEDDDYKKVQPPESPQLTPSDHTLSLLGKLYEPPQIVKEIETSSTSTHQLQKYFAPFYVGIRT